MGNDLTPTSLNEGRGGVLVPVIVVVSYMGLKCRLVGRWMGPWWYEPKGERAAKCGNVPNAEEARKSRIWNFRQFGGSRKGGNARLC